MYFELTRAKLLGQTVRLLTIVLVLYISVSELAPLFSKVNPKNFWVIKLYELRDISTAVDASVKLNKDFIIPHTQKAIGTEKAVLGYPVENFFPWFVPLKYSFQSNHHDKGSI